MSTDVNLLQADIGTPDPQRPDSGRIVFSAECSACAGPALQVRYELMKDLFSLALKMAQPCQ